MVWQFAKLHSQCLYKNKMSCFRYAMLFTKKGEIKTAGTID